MEVSPDCEGDSVVNPKVDESPPSPDAPPESGVASSATADVVLDSSTTVETGTICSYGSLMTDSSVVTTGISTSDEGNSDTVISALETVVDSSSLSGLMKSEDSGDPVDEELNHEAMVVPTEVTTLEWPVMSSIVDAIVADDSPSDGGGAEVVTSSGTSDRSVADASPPPSTAIDP